MEGLFLNNGIIFSKSEISFSSIKIPTCIASALLVFHFTIRSSYNCCKSVFLNFPADIHSVGFSNQYASKIVATTD